MSKEMKESQEMKDTSLVTSDPEKTITIMGTIHRLIIRIMNVTNPVTRHFNGTGH
jgi:hypothetical protein